MKKQRNITKLMNETAFEVARMLSPLVKASLFLFLMMASVKYLTGELYGFGVMYLMASLYWLDEVRKVKK